MNNCSVKQFKKEAENNSLVKIGELRIHIANSDSSEILPFFVVSSAPVDIEIIGDGYFYKGTVSSRTDQATKLENISSTAGYRLSEGTYDVSISNKYGLTRISFGSTSPNSVSEVLNRSVGLDIDDIYSQLESLALGNSDSVKSLVGDISSLPEDIELTVYNTGVKGTMTDIAKRICYSGSFMFCPGPNVSGSVEEFVENAKSTLYYSKTFTFKYRYLYDNSRIRFNNVFVTEILKLVFDASGNCEVRLHSNNSLLATYTKSTNTWVYS